MPTDDNDAYGDLDKSNLKFIYEQFLNHYIRNGVEQDEKVQASSGNYGPDDGSDSHVYGFCFGGCQLG